MLSLGKIGHARLEIEADYSSKVMRGILFASYTSHFYTRADPNHLRNFFVSSVKVHVLEYVPMHTVEVIELVKYPLISFCLPADNFNQRLFFLPLDCRWHNQASLHHHFLSLALILTEFIRSFEKNRIHF